MQLPHVRGLPSAALLIGTLLLGVGCSQASAPPDISRQLHRLAELTEHSEGVWPGFDLRSHVLIATVVPAGPMYVIGDSAPPPDFRWADPVGGIAVREGLPLPEFLGLRVAGPWRDRQGVATSFPFSEQTAPHLTSALVHEAFHTHQQKLNRESRELYVARGNACFPATSVHDLALLNLEGHYLVEALRSATEGHAWQSARLALAVRQERCDRLGPDECARQRALEQLEGTASYVEAVLTGSLSRYGAHWRDSLASALPEVTIEEELVRGHYYESGLTWLLLLERLDMHDWKESVAATPPDALLAEHLDPQNRNGWGPLSRAATESDAWTTAYARADEAIKRWSGPGSKVRAWLRRSSEPLQPECRGTFAGGIGGKY